MKRRSKLWVESDPADPPAEPAPKTDLDSIFAGLMAQPDEPSEEELNSLTERLRREGSDEAADLIDAETEA